MPSPRNSPKNNRERRVPSNRVEFLSLTSQRNQASLESPSHRKDSTALLLDLVLVAAVKGLVKRKRPAHNKMDMFATVSVDKYSFPSGHATRAAMVCRFLLHHLVLAVPLRVLVLLWAIIVGLSRIMLGRHNVTDVVFGIIMGYMQYSIVEYFWLSPLTVPALFTMWN